MKNKGFTAEEIAATVDGRFEGNSKHHIDRLVSLPFATAGTLCFISHESLVKKLPVDCAALVMVPQALQGQIKQDRIVVKDIQQAYARASQLFAGNDGYQTGVHPSAVIDPAARIDSGVNIGPLSVVGAGTVISSGVSVGSGVNIAQDCVIGKNTQIADGVCLNRKSSIGERCVISSGAVIGASGFGYAWDGDSASWLRIEQLGGVDIGDDVDIGAGCTIDRGAIDNTVIEHGVKLDNQVMIAHNVKVGANTIMAGCVAVAGSTTIGQRCRFGGRSSILGQLEIGDVVIINSLTIVTKSLPEAGTYSSVIPAKKVNTWRKTLAGLNRLTKLTEKVAKLETESKK